MDFNKIAERRLIVKATVGSQLYGTNSENSDKDYVGIFMPDDNILYGMYKCEQVEIRTNGSGSGVKNLPSDIDCTIYEFRKFIHLAQKATPNILEFLFVPQDMVIIDSEDFEELQENASMFISKRIFDTFMGYAVSQERLLKTKTIRYKALLKMYEYLLSVVPQDRMSPLGADNRNELINIYPDFRNKRGDIKQFDETMPFEYVFKNIEREVNGYGYRKENILKHNYEIKFGSHLVRLLLEGIELAETGKIEYPLHTADIIKSIKYGDVEEKEFYSLVDDLKKQFREVESKSSLPETPDMDVINKFQIKMIKRCI